MLNDTATKDIHSIESCNGDESIKKIPTINGNPLEKLPEDLYIPPDALEIFLESFEGPLDLLLYLIKRNNLDIINIKVALITEQYMDYVNTMQASRFELAAEYLVMAATLIEIKSRMLLPRAPTETEEDEEDPRAELIRRLQAYECIKKVAVDIDAMPRMYRDIWPAVVQTEVANVEVEYLDINVSELLSSLSLVLNKANLFENHTINSEVFSVKQRMLDIMELLRSDRFTPFVALFDITEGKLGIVVTFIAVLELAKEFTIDLMQNEPYGQIHVRMKS